MSEVEFDINKLKEALDRAAEVINRGATTALSQIKDDWVREAVDIAPKDTGALRREIHGAVIGSGTNGMVQIVSNAYSSTGGRRFNYAYYIHENNAGGKSLRTPGTVKQYLKESAERRMTEYERWLTEDIRNELKKAGW